MIVGHLEKCGLSSDCQYGSRPSQSTADLLTVVSDRIAKAFNRSGATQAVALDISKAFSGQIFGLISSFLSNRQLQVVLDGKSLQEYSVNAGVPQGSILGPTLFRLYINELLYINDTTLYPEYDLQDTVDWGRKWLVPFNAGKTQLVSFDQSKNPGAIDVKLYGSALEEKSSFKMPRLTFCSKLNWGSYIISIAKTASKKIEALVHS